MEQSMENKVMSVLEDEKINLTYRFRKKWMNDTHLLDAPQTANE